MKMHQASFRNAHRDVNDNIWNKSARTKFLKREGVEEKHDGTHPKSGQTETPTMNKEKSQVDNVVPNSTEIKSMAAQHVARTKEQLVANELATLVVDSLDDILQCSYEMAHR